MSYFNSTAPVCRKRSGAIALLIEPKRKDLGEFSVARALPAPQRRMVGPFIFFDHMGPADFEPGQGMQVRPHPHIGIAAITYLFEGLIVHRDSLGFVQPIEAGAVNLMVAGRGIVHSERAGDDLDRHSRLHGIQSWLALPDADLETDPAFVHYPASDIPEHRGDGTIVRVIIGEGFGRSSPVRRFIDTLYWDCRLDQSARLAVPPDVPELAIYVVSGEAEIDSEPLTAGSMAILSTGVTAEVVARRDSRLMVLGGAAVGPREIWWNFVAPDSSRIEQAKLDWVDGRFGSIEGDDEFIPLPD